VFVVLCRSRAAGRSLLEEAEKLPTVKLLELLERSAPALSAEHRAAAEKAIANKWTASNGQADLDPTLVSSEPERLSRLVLSVPRSVGGVSLALALSSTLRLSPLLS
jgi:hypothetical protein